MSKEQIKKDLTMQLGVVKMKLKQLVFIEEQPGIWRTEEIHALRDRLNLIEKILKRWKMSNNSVPQPMGNLKK